MKKKQVVELRQKTDHELKKMIDEKKKELAKVKLDLSLAKSKNTAVVKTLKKEIAQVLTVIHMKGVK